MPTTNAHRMIAALSPPFLVASLAAWLLASGAACQKSKPADEPAPASAPAAAPAAPPPRRGPPGTPRSPAP